MDKIIDESKARPDVGCTELLGSCREIANNAIYFADNSDYRSALWEICSLLGMSDDEIGDKFMERQSSVSRRECGMNCKLQRLVVPRFVYRLQPSSGKCRTYEIGECDNPRSYDGWCDRRVCEGFWGNEQLCRQTVEAMNTHNAENQALTR